MLASLAVVAVAALAVLALVPDRFRVGGFTESGSPSVRALAIMRRGLGYDPEPGMVIVARSATGLNQTATAMVQDLAARAAQDPAVGFVETAFGPRAVPPLLAANGRDTLILVHFRSSDPDALKQPIARLRRELRSRGPLSLRFGGYAVGFLDVNRIARADLVRAELIAFPVLAILLLAIFRGVAAAMLPVLVGGMAVVGTLGVLRLLGAVMDISIFALNLAVLLGLGLAVDYSLLMVSRFREEVTRGSPRAQAVATTRATAGRTVAFSGLAVAAACSALLLFPQHFIFSMGIAGMLVSLLAAGAALLVTPAVLMLSGERIAAREQAQRGSWTRWAGWVMRNHRDVAIITSALLVAAAAPVLGLKLTFGEAAAVPPGVESRTVTDTIARDFPAQLEYPVNVLIRTNQPGAPEDLVAVHLVRTPGVAGFHILAYAQAGRALLQLELAQPPLTDASQRVVRLARARPATVAVGGRTAEFVDLKSSIAGRLPLAMLLAALLAGGVVVALTRSIVLGVKALLFNAIGISAAFGLLVLIFQHQALGIVNLLGYQGPAAVEINASVVIVAATFGLAMDYSILLLSRITEEHRAGHSDRAAVARGLQRSGPVITSAAAVMAVALLALTSSRVFLVKELTVGLALGVVLDATLIRMLLVPAAMRILGRANWWAPGPLRRRLDRGGAGPAV